MPENTDEGGDEERYVAVDPVELEEGDDIIVKDVTGDLNVRGTVLDTKNEAGRIGVEIHEQEADRESMVWEETGRTFTRVEQ